MLTPLKDLPKTYRALGYAGPPSRAAAESVSSFIIPDMFAKACQGMPPKDAVAWAESELKKILARG
jgi:multiple sugar transport system substrate-binding protein